MSVICMLRSWSSLIAAILASCAAFSLAFWAWSWALSFSSATRARSSASLASSFNSSARALVASSAKNACCSFLARITCSSICTSRSSCSSVEMGGS